MSLRQKLTIINAYAFIISAAVILLLHNMQMINENIIPLIKILALIVFISFIILLITIPFFHKKNSI